MLMSEKQEKQEIFKNQLYEKFFIELKKKYNMDERLFITVSFIY